MRLSTEQGWNQTEKDWKLIITSSQNSCLLAESHGKTVGTTAAMNYSNEVAWINMVLVDKEYRRRGISKMLFENILDRLKPCKSIKLDATIEGQQVYKQFNFKEEYTITRMTADEIQLPLTNDSEKEIELIQPENVKEVIDFDEMIFGANRNLLISSMVKEYPHNAWMLKRNNALVGFALGRDGRKCNQIGPVMAVTSADAISLIKTSLRESIEKPILVDVMNDKTEIKNLLSSIGFAQQRHFIRMYQNDNPFPGKANDHFLICGPEFG